MTNNTQEKQKLIEAFNNSKYLSDYTEDIDTALDYYDGDTCVDNFTEWFTENYIHSADIVYYSNAIKFLSKEDPSLQTSSSLAHDRGYTLENINSETLATILLQDILREELEELKPYIVDYFDSLED